jgi:hypothetical protein
MPSEILGITEQIASILSPFVPLLLSTTGGVVTLGIVSRRPLGSALRLATRSRLRSPRLPESHRTSDVHFIRHMLETVNPYQYIVVKGLKGVGKTCIIETVTNRTCGVVEITVAAGKGSDEIVRSALEAIGYHPDSLFNSRNGVQPILWWYNLFAKKPPIVVLNAVERSQGDRYAQVAGAARQLTGKYRLRVVIDSSTNSLEPEVEQTGREVVIEVTEMSREELWSVDEFQHLLRTLENNNVHDIAWAVFGGLPMHYSNLMTLLEGVDGNGIRAVVERYMREKLIKAMRCRDRALQLHPGKRNIFQEFKAKNQLSEKAVDLETTHFSLPDKVLRLALRDYRYVFVPADPCAAFVLRYDLQSDSPPTLREVEQLISSNKLLSAGPQESKSDF